MATLKDGDGTLKPTVSSSGTEKSRAKVTVSPSSTGLEVSPTLLTATVGASALWGSMLR